MKHKTQYQSKGCFGKSKPAGSNNRKRSINQMTNIASELFRRNQELEAKLKEFEEAKKTEDPLEKPTPKTTVIPKEDQEKNG